MNDRPQRPAADACERRRDPRYDAEFPARIIVGEGRNETVFEARVRNVSRGGLLVEAPGIPPGETRVRVHFRIPDGAFPEEFVHGAISTTAVIRRRDGGDRTLGLALSEPLASGPARAERTARLGGILLPVLGVLLLLLPRWMPWGPCFDPPILLFGLAAAIYALDRGVRAARYRPAWVPREIPRLSVLIAVRDGQDAIARTLRGVMQSDYPADRLQVIVVDDASTDGTLEAIQSVRKAWPDIVVVHLLEPAGRRYALTTGVALATGSLIAFCDPDGGLPPDALRNLVSRFADPDVAAVAGRAEVSNEPEGLLARIRGAAAFLSGRVLRAAENASGAVSCLSTPLLAFRRGALNEALDEWLAQRIQEDPASFGTAHGLIGCILRRGGRVAYEHTARIAVRAPIGFAEFGARFFRNWADRIEEDARTPGWPRANLPLGLLPIRGGTLLALLSPFLFLRALAMVARDGRPGPILCLGALFAAYALACGAVLLFRRPRGAGAGLAWGILSVFLTILLSPGIFLRVLRPGPRGRTAGT